MSWRTAFALPTQWHFEESSFEAWNGARFSSYFQASLIVVVPVVFFFNHSFNHVWFWFRHVFIIKVTTLLLLIILIGLMVSFEAVIIPLWQIMNDLGLLNTYWAL